MKDNMKNKSIVFLLLITAFFIACEEGFIKSPFSQHWGVPEYDNSGASKSLNVAAVSFYVDISPQKNLDKMVAFVDKIEIEQPNIRLILFPETILGYYYKPSNPLEYQKSIAETIPGGTTNVISQKAIEHDIYISFGMVEKWGEDLYNSQVLIGPTGSILSVHHKNHLVPWDKENGFKAGNGITINVIDNIKVATIICYDGMFLDMYKEIHESGAELLLLPIANTYNKTNLDLVPINYTSTWVLCANRVGDEDGNNYDGWLYLSTPSREPKIIISGKEDYIYGVVKCR